MSRQRKVIGREQMGRPFAAVEDLVMSFASDTLSVNCLNYQ